jgi:hypothetical protein
MHFLMYKNYYYYQATSNKNEATQIYFECSVPANTALTTAQWFDIRTSIFYPRVRTYNAGLSFALLLLLFLFLLLLLLLVVVVVVGDTLIKLQLQDTKLQWQDTKLQWQDTKLQ